MGSRQRDGKTVGRRTLKTSEEIGASEKTVRCTSVELCEP